MKKDGDEDFVKCHYRVQSNSDSATDPSVQHGFAGAVIHDQMMAADSNWQVLKMHRQARGGGYSQNISKTLQQYAV